MHRAHEDSGELFLSMDWYKNKKQFIIILFVGIGAFSISYYGDDILFQISAYQTRISQTGSVVSISAGVAENEYNTLAEELDQKERLLDARDRALAERASVEIDDDTVGGKKSDLAIVYTTAIGFLLLVLVLLNFYMDWKRRAGNNDK